MASNANSIYLMLTLQVGATNGQKTGRTGLQNLPLPLSTESAEWYFSFAGTIIGNLYRLPIGSRAAALSLTMNSRRFLKARLRGWELFHQAGGLRGPQTPRDRVSGLFSCLGP